MRDWFGARILDRLRFALPWQTLHLSKKLGLSPMEAFELFEEARRDQAAKDWSLALASMVGVLLLVMLASFSGSPELLRFSVPMGFLLMFIVLLLRACYHYQQHLLGYLKGQRTLF